MLLVLLNPAPVSPAFCWLRLLTDSTRSLAEVRTSAHLLVPSSKCMEGLPPSLVSASPRGSARRRTEINSARPTLWRPPWRWCSDTGPLTMGHAQSTTEAADTASSPSHDVDQQQWSAAFAAEYQKLSGGRSPPEAVLPAFSTGACGSDPAAVGSEAPMHAKRKRIHDAPQEYHAQPSQPAWCKSQHRRSSREAVGPRDPSRSTADAGTSAGDARVPPSTGADAWRWEPLQPSRQRAAANRAASTRVPQVSGDFNGELSPLEGLGNSDHAQHEIFRLEAALASLYESMDTTVSQQLKAALQTQSSESDQDPSIERVLSETDLATRGAAACAAQARAVTMAMRSSHHGHSDKGEGAHDVASAFDSAGADATGSELSSTSSEEGVSSSTSANTSAPPSLLNAVSALDGPKHRPPDKYCAATQQPRRLPPAQLLVQLPVGSAYAARSPAPATQPSQHQRPHQHMQTAYGQPVAYDGSYYPQYPPSHDAFGRTPYGYEAYASESHYPPHATSHGSAWHHPAPAHVLSGCGPPPLVPSGSSGSVGRRSKSDRGDDDDEAGSSRELTRKPWLDTEDQTILDAVQEMGFRWRIIASLLPGRSDDAVRNRWNRLQEAIRDGTSARLLSNDRPKSGYKCSKCGQPKRNHVCTFQPSTVQDAAEINAHRSPRSGALDGDRLRVSWSRHEDDTIRMYVASLGPRWALIAAKLPGRTEHAVRNRWHRLQNLDSNYALIDSNSSMVSHLTATLYSPTPLHNVRLLALASNDSHLAGCRVPVWTVRWTRASRNSTSTWASTTIRASRPSRACDRSRTCWRSTATAVTQARVDTMPRRPNSLPARSASCCLLLGQT